MKRHLLTTPLAAGLLLLATLGCSEMQIEAPATIDNQQLNGSYKLNGELVKCKVEEEAYLATEGGQTLEVIQLWLTTVPQPASGEELIALTFSKPVTQSAFTLAEMGITHYRYPQLNGQVLRQSTSTATRTVDGGFSGTFSGVARGTSTQQDFRITDGVFTDVHR